MADTKLWSKEQTNPQFIYLQHIFYGRKLWI
jgi:hypothetical protein